MRKIRVLLVEDSLTVRGRLREVLASDPELELIGEAEDGRRAVELCASLRPDVVSLDMHLPLLSGLDATEHIMAHSPTPILIVSASVNRGELFKTYDALKAGAVEVLEKPLGDEEGDQWERRYLSTLKLVSRIKVITHPRARLGAMGRAAGSSSAAGSAAVVGSVVPPPAKRGAFRVLALGASTGGPGALVEVLQALPCPFPLPLLFVLHIDEPFSIAFAEWLENQTGQRVRYARHGEALYASAGEVLMAPPGKHLVARGGRLQLTADGERHSCRPSIDVLFESLAAECGAGTLACLLTGMGRDGAAGLLAVRRAGGFTVAQDEASCVIYGMPREAVLLGAVESVLPLSAIGTTIGELTASRRAGP